MEGSLQKHNGWLQTEWFTNAVLTWTEWNRTELDTLAHCTTVERSGARAAASRSHLNTHKWPVEQRWLWLAASHSCSMTGSIIWASEHRSIGASEQHLHIQWAMLLSLWQYHMIESTVHHLSTEQWAMINAHHLSVICTASEHHHLNRLAASLPWRQYLPSENHHLSVRLSNSYPDIGTFGILLDDTIMKVLLHSREESRTYQCFTVPTKVGSWHPWLTTGPTPNCYRCQWQPDPAGSLSPLSWRQLVMPSFQTGRRLAIWANHQTHLLVTDQWSGQTKSPFSCRSCPLSLVRYNFTFSPQTHGVYISLCIVKENLYDIVEINLINWSHVLLQQLDNTIKGKLLWMNWRWFCFHWTLICNWQLAIQSNWWLCNRKKGKSPVSKNLIEGK